MGEIVPFRVETPADEGSEDARVAIWTCAACGAQTFYLHSTGHTECVSCNLMSTDGDEDCDRSWRERKPAVPEEIEELDSTNHIVRWMEPEQIKRRFSKHMLESDPVAIWVLARDGGADMWSEGVASLEQLEWMEARLVTLRDYITKTCRSF